MQQFGIGIEKRLYVMEHIYSEVYYNVLILQRYEIHGVQDLLLSKYRRSGAPLTFSSLLNTAQSWIQEGWSNRNMLGG